MVVRVLDDSISYSDDRVKARRGYLLVPKPLREMDGTQNRPV